MKLNSIILQNFKGIDNLEIKLDNKKVGGVRHH